MATVTLAQALNQALHDEMEADDRVLVFGEDVGVLGGVFRVTDKLQERFGEERCFDTPLAESAIIGTSLGLALYGYRPVSEIQFDGFAYPGFEQLVSHIAKYRNRSRGTVTMPVTVRIPFGGGIGAVEHHSESPENFFAHVAGLKVVTPGTPSDGYSLLREAITSLDPVLFFEPKRRYWLKEDAELPVRTEPFGAAVVRRQAGPGGGAGGRTDGARAYHLSRQADRILLFAHMHTPSFTREPYTLLNAPDHAPLNIR
jgi:2-oxoisovalerate dehydrogenase E1 component beta subunit